MAEAPILSNLVNLSNQTTAVTTINNNNAAITAAFLDVMSLSGVSPNQMKSNLDMNGNQILNLPAPATLNSPVRLVDVASNPTISVPPTGTSGGTVGFLNGNNTYSGTSTFTGAVTFSGSSITNSSNQTNSATNSWSGVNTFSNTTNLAAIVSTGTNTYSGTNTFNNTVTFTSGITSVNETWTGTGTYTDGNNPTTLVSVGSNSNFVTSNLSLTGPRFQISYVPTQTTSSVQTMQLYTTGRLQLMAQKPGGTGNNPQIIIADTNVLGVPVLNGGNQSGIGLITNGVSGSAACNVSIINTGGASTGAYNSAILEIWGTDSIGGTQNLITFFNGTGTSAWNGTLTATQAGSRLGEIAGQGVTPDGKFTQTETWSINGYADQAFTGTTNDGTYTAPSNIVFRIPIAATSPETGVGGFYWPGTLAVGNYPASGNSFTGGQGTITMKLQAGSAPLALAGSGILYVTSAGALHYRGPTTDTQLAIA
jgi:hypothetical protein